MDKKAVIFGLEGTVLKSDERDFFKETKPLGFIFFKRNIEDREQFKRLIFSLKESLADNNLLFLIDQEGGRVKRLRLPISWYDYPSAEKIGNFFKENKTKGKRFAYLNSLFMGLDLKNIGINIDCAPVLDLRYEGASSVIGDRAFADNPQTVKILAENYALGLIHAGITPVIKHIPGHGRSLNDTHTNISRVEAALEEMQKTDFIPFKDFVLPVLGMMSHIIYTAVDAKNPATISTKIKKLIRKEIGFKGLLLSDDFSMKALTSFNDNLGGLAKTALTGAVDVILHCNGDFKEMQLIAKELKTFSKAKNRILQKTLAKVKPDLDINSLKQEYERLYGTYFV